MPKIKWGLPWWLSSIELPANAGDMGSLPGQENPLKEEFLGSILA